MSCRLLAVLGTLCVPCFAAPASAVVIDSWDDSDPEMLRLEAAVLVDRESQKKIVIGKQGNVLKTVGSAARVEIERLLESRVFLRLWVKVRQDWREDESTLREIGLDEKDTRTVNVRPGVLALEADGERVRATVRLLGQGNVRADELVRELLGRPVPGARFVRETLLLEKDGVLSEAVYLVEPAHAA